MRSFTVSYVISVFITWQLCNNHTVCQIFTQKWTQSHTNWKVQKAFKEDITTCCSRKSTGINNNIRMAFCTLESNRVVIVVIYNTSLLWERSICCPIAAHLQFFSKYEVKISSRLHPTTFLSYWNLFILVPQMMKVPFKKEKVQLLLSG